MSIIEQLRNIMKREKISQTKIAEAMNTDRRNIHDALKRDMRISKLESIAEAIGYEVKILKKK